MTSPPGDPVVLTVPTDPTFLRLVRLTASGVGSLAGFDVATIEDFRIAVDEACTSLAATCTGDELEVRFTIDDEAIRVCGHIAGGMASAAAHGPFDTVEPEQEGFAARILDVLTDHHHLAFDRTGAHFELKKRRSALIPAARSNPPARAK